MATIETAWRELRAALEGEVVRPGSPRYDEVRKPQIPRFHDVRPQAVVLCRTPEDVAKAIALAHRSGIEVAVRSGGHDFAGSSCTPPARGAYANFPDTELPDEHRAYWGSNLARVQRVKEKYDPERVFG